jgi:cbb3-type cytochrome oxidase maturation protein
MIILLVLIPVALLPIGAAGIALFWAVGNDQADDMRTPGLLLGGIATDGAGDGNRTHALGGASKPIKRDV